ncbi:unnamed protein product [Blumeria hordei]|uniref:ATP-dependent protease n=1 Tax=Blumeria hordei TaxID=2867405 RepID=A0A383UT93_BLUHO|nr:unnamed protein product [Blumeria hordei]
MSSLPLVSGTRAIPLISTHPRVSNDSTSGHTHDDDPLDASKDARQIVRIAQCPKCSYPLQEPVTLPCGNTLCRRCIPTANLRQTTSFPFTPNRYYEFTCPFPNCALNHSTEECNVNVVLNKIIILVRHEMEKAKAWAEASKVVVQLQERNTWSDTPSTLPLPRTQVLPGGRLLATYTMAELGELSYDSDVSYASVSGNTEQSETVDRTILHHLKKAIRGELDCHVCYGVFLNPFTTTCGHTFCRTCLRRVFDHSDLCPICRAPQKIPHGVSSSETPSIILSKLLNGLCPEALIARAEIAKNEEKLGSDDMEVPVFICTLSFPSMPTFLHIFEPRYRLMIRRAVESGDRNFGMLLYNQKKEPQGEHGQVDFYEYGTLLHIVNVHNLSDGRSLTETIGLSRFKVMKHGIKDDYMIAKVKLVEDVPLAVEEALEAHEISVSESPNYNREFSLGENMLPRYDAQSSDSPATSYIERRSTRELFTLSVNFVKKMREQSAPWLQTRVFEVYGEFPQDPSLFPWWFASVLPISDTEKYKLLSTVSVRERLKICADWVTKIESQRWYVCHFSH